MTEIDWSSLANIGIAAITAGHLAQALLVLFVCLIAMKLIIKIFDRAVGRMGMERNLNTFIHSALKIALYFLIIIIVADSLGIKVTSLVALFSVVGLAVSLAMQGILSNIAGGIMILISKPFVVEDYIQTGSAEGYVYDIGLVYTVLRTYDNKLISIPNGDISGSSVINYTSQSSRRVELFFEASYENEIDDVKYAIKSVFQGTPIILWDPEPFVGVEEYKESSIRYAVRAWCKTEDYWTLYYRLQEDVKRVFDENGIQMTYNHLNIHLIREREGERDGNR